VVGVRQRLADRPRANEKCYPNGSASQIGLPVRLMQDWVNLMRKIFFQSIRLCYASENQDRFGGLSQRQSGPRFSLRAANSGRFRTALIYFQLAS
jgi:hypothetical protein